MYWTHQTRHGLWAIVQSEGGRWHPMLDDEDLGSYQTAEQALDDLAGGHSTWPTPLLDPSTCGLPDELADWKPHTGHRADLGL